MDWQGEGLQDTRGLGSVPTTCAGVRGTAGSPPALGLPVEPQWPLQTEAAEARPPRQALSSNQRPGWPVLDCFPRDERTVWAPSVWGAASKEAVGEAQDPHGHRPLVFPAAALASVAPAVLRGHLVSEAAGGELPRGPYAPCGRLGPLL